jgi:GTPase SAR1 family protein
MILQWFFQYKYGIHVNNIFNKKAGAERYRAITTSHIRNADGAYLVYDVTSEASFNTLDYWYDSITKSTNDDIVVYLVGNKSDLTVGSEAQPRKVSKEQALDLTKKYNLNGWTECSAKDNINIKETFVSFYKSTCLKKITQ